MVHQTTAMASISTGTPLGSCLTAIQVLAGLWSPNASAYPLLTASKLAMSVMKTTHLTMFFTVAPGCEAFRTASRFAMHALACSGRG